MIKVAIVGTGNVSYHLQNAFSKSEEIQLVEVLESRSLNADTISNLDFDVLREPDIYIMAISDDAIIDMAQNFKATKKMVVHTSGSVPLDSLLPITRRGVFYPLQSFSKDRALDLKTVPLCLEANTIEDLKLLKKVSEAVSAKVYEIDSEQRKALHLAAVFVNNFSNHLYHVGNEICKKNNLSFDMLKPLIMETASKIETLDPIEAQTGPAKRNDSTTINRHFGQLKSQRHKEIYSIMTKSIQDFYGKKL